MNFYAWKITLISVSWKYKQQWCSRNRGIFLFCGSEKKASRCYRLCCSLQKCSLVFNCKLWSNSPDSTQFHLQPQNTFFTWAVAPCIQSVGFPVKTALPRKLFQAWKCELAENKGLLCFGWIFPTRWHRRPVTGLSMTWKELVVSITILETLYKNSLNLSMSCWMSMRRCVWKPLQL